MSRAEEYYQYCLALEADGHEFCTLSPSEFTYTDECCIVCVPELPCTKHEVKKLATSNSNKNK